MFKSILIANRGEIAHRILKTAKKMEIQVVTLHTKEEYDSPHVLQADHSVLLDHPKDFVDQEKIIQIAKAHGAEAIHPGYGFLSENPEFSEACVRANICFIGPTAKQIKLFGLKHEARKIAEDSGLPLTPGSPILKDIKEAFIEADRIGFPVMLKSTAGGGGIGMVACENKDSLKSEFDRVQRLASSHFKHAGVYLEKLITRAKHIEVQVFGDGKGNALTLGERDCSIQRRNQKVIEETPAPGLTDDQRTFLFDAAKKLCKSVQYASAGTVEFIYDMDEKVFYFLEFNSRLQVEHTVTEEVFDVDLVEWMILLAAGESLPWDSWTAIVPKGHAVQARIYTEDPFRDHQPSSGTLTKVAWPKDVAGNRVDTWVQSGTDVTPFYDPLLAKFITKHETREQTLEQLKESLTATQISGIQTNLKALVDIVADEKFQGGDHTTSFLKSFSYVSHAIEVIQAGTFTTVQDFPGRLNHWGVGVPPSGPMDSLNFRLGNRILGNQQTAAGLEMTVHGCGIKFRSSTQFCLTGAHMAPTLNDKKVPAYVAIDAKEGDVLTLQNITGPGQRTYLTFKGGLDIPEYLGSKSTFSLGQFGGHGGRILRAGDVIPLGLSEQTSPKVKASSPKLTHEWEVGVMIGPHGAPDFFHEEGMEEFFSAQWTVHYHSDRTGVRLIGPKPKWTRKDGGEAGLHPSNIHDNAYAIGTIDFTGDLPVILGPDGPSLGGFVCPATIIPSERWKMGQFKPGDKIKFIPVAHETALETHQGQEEFIQSLEEIKAPYLVQSLKHQDQVVAQWEMSGELVLLRQSGPDYLLLEVGPLMLDLKLRMLIQLVYEWINEKHIHGIIDLTPGIRSLQIHFDPLKLAREKIVGILKDGSEALTSQNTSTIESRVVHLPLSWDDPSTQEAIEKYVKTVRSDAPWCPDNIEFIRRINGLKDKDAVKDIVFSANYLVMGLGDVYLGAPVATPLDPRHRLVTTKYNPARTWTPENAVGIGGAYMCIYGMEGPGGYQFVGRTVPVWNRYRVNQNFKEGRPWLLRLFDQIKYYPVSQEELSSLRQDVITGKEVLKIENSKFDPHAYQTFLKKNEVEIRAFKKTQNDAFQAEREMWKEKGLDQFQNEIANTPTTTKFELPVGTEAVLANVSGGVWKVLIQENEKVEKGQVLLILESMKTEFPIEAPKSGVIKQILIKEGMMVNAGDTVLAIE